MTKPTIASDWMAGCAGCHMSLLDMDERLAAIAAVADIRATPITDLKEPDEAGVDVGILEGAVNNSSNEEVAHRMRRRCQQTQNEQALSCNSVHNDPHPTAHRYRRPLGQGRISWRRPQRDIGSRPTCGAVAQD